MPILVLLAAACEASTAGSSEADTDANRRPVAVAGQDRRVAVADLVELDGRRSTDPDGDPLHFAWAMRSRPDGSAAHLVHDDQPRAAFAPDLPGAYVVGLVVSDGTVESDLAVVVVTAAGDTGQPGAPVAVILGADQVAVGREAAFDGSASFDPDGGPLLHRWSLRKPDGSAAALADPSATVATFVPDRAGSYGLTLVVVDDEGLASRAATHAVTAQGQVSADAGPDREVVFGEAVALDGSGSVAAPGEALRFSWSMVARPAGSEARLSSPSDARPSFVADRPGSYEARLVVTAGSRTDEDTVTITARLPPSDGIARRLGYEVLDAEYSRSLDRLVAISASPPLLHVIEPHTGAEVTVTLPRTPQAVSVSPDGRRAAVLFDGHVSQLDLEVPALSVTHSIAAPGGDVVYAGNGFAYVFPNIGQWTRIEAVDLATGRSVASTGMSVRERTRAKLHPGGLVLYGADNGVSPDDLERYAIAADGTPSVAYDSPYHGDYDVGGDLWLSEDGQRIFTRGGNVFRTSDSRSADMTYAGSLDGVQPLHVDHHGATGRIVAAPAGLGYQALRYSRVTLFDDEYLAFLGDKSLPPVVLGTREEILYARMAFFDAAGSSVFVIADPDPASGLLEDCLVTFRLDEGT